MIAINLQDALNHSVLGQSQKNRSMLPRDLETSAMFLEVVAE